MAGHIQDADIKSVSELTSPSSLPNDDKIYVTANSINKTLKQAIIDNDIGGGGTPGFYGISKFTASTALINNAASFTTRNDANYATVTYEGDASAPTVTNDLGFKIASLPAGTYKVRFNATMQVTGSTSRTQGQYRIWDGTTSSPVSVVICGTASTDDGTSFGVEGIFTYGSTQTNINFVIQSLRATGTGDVYVYTPAHFTIEAIPSAGVDGANKSLSNLNPTAINEDLIFGADGSPNPSVIKTSDSASEITADLTIQTGDQTNVDNSGNLNIESGDSTTTSGNISISSGAGINTGNISLTTPTGSGAGGNISLTTGNGNNNGGNISLTAGNSNAVPGRITLISGDGANGVPGGNVEVFTSPSATLGCVTGAIHLKSGLHTNGTETGEIKLETGSTDVNGSGNIHLLTGAVVDPTDSTGDIILETGTPSALPLTYQGNVVVTAKFFRFPKHSSAPSGMVSGDAYYNTTTNKLMVYDGSTFQAAW